MNILLGLLLCMGATQSPVDARNPEPIMALPGDTVELLLDLEIATGFQVQANPVRSDFLIPLELLGEDDDGLSIVSIEYPQGVPDPTDSGHADPYCYVGAIQLKVTLRLSEHLDPGSHSLRARLRYQACSPGHCYAPMTMAVDLPVEVGRRPELAKAG